MLAPSLLLWASFTAAAHAAAIEYASRSVQTRGGKVDRSVKLTRSPQDNQHSSRYLRHSVASSVDGGAQLFATGTSFLAEIEIGGQTFIQIVDTGSSDTWLPSNDFVCVSPLPPYEVLPQADCLFGPTFTPDSSFQQIPNENFNTSYGSGEFINGILGTDTVTFANLTIPKQEIALATVAGFQGDGLSSGIIGLAYPGITNSYPGTNASADVACKINASAPCNVITYSPVINSIFFVDNLTDPLFTLSLSRDVSASGYGGVLTIGDLPDFTDPTINVTSYTAQAATPIAMLHLDDVYRYYTLQVEGLDYNNSADNAGTGQYIADSGTTLLYAPAAIAAAYNNGFEPPAEYNATAGGFVVACKPRVVPSLGVTIGGRTFNINARDLVVDVGEVPGKTCVSGVLPSSGLPGGLSGILGDVFLNNVLAVFDVGKEQMTFYEREYYES